MVVLGGLKISPGVVARLELRQRDRPDVPDGIHWLEKGAGIPRLWCHGAV